MELGTLPGTLLRPQDLKIGQKVHARDAGRYWYPAEVVETRRGRQPAAYVTYDRFPSTHDEWLSAPDLRVPISAADLALERAAKPWTEGPQNMNEDGTWPVDRILKVKKVAGVKKYLVRWQDWSPDYDFWEPAKNVARDVIADFKDELAERERDEAKVAKQPRREPAPPFSVSEANAESADVKAVRVADAAVLLEDISSEAGQLTSRQKKPKAEMKIYDTKPRPRHTTSASTRTSAIGPRSSSPMRSWRTWSPRSRSTGEARGPSTPFR